MKTTVFMSGNSQAIRIPSSMRIDSQVVEISEVKRGTLVIKSTEDPWKLFREGAKELAKDWPDRNQPEAQEIASW